MTTTLKERIIRHIKVSGPLPLAEYMHWCLFDKVDGYYTTNKIFGRTGDFVTAPEISQMFGELMGIWLLQAWKSLCEPAKFNLIELGPGKGTLMNDILRACRVKPEFLDAATIHLIETSGQLATHQRNTLNTVKNIHWHKTLENVPDGVSMIVANEFLDAIPFRQYVKTDKGWHERCVIVGDNGNLDWGLGPGKLEEAALPLNHGDEPEGAVFEVSTMREAFVEKVAERVGNNGGAAILIDYGHPQSGFGDTFQAIRAHEYANPLEFPGTCDLTSHVDFDPFTEIVHAQGCHPHPLMTQGEFLLKTGLLERAGSLGSGKTSKEQLRIKSEAERLALPDKMGNLFKVFAFSSGPVLWPFDESA